MSEAYDIDELESGELEDEELLDEDAGYGASQQGDAGLEGPGDQSGMGELEEEDENWAD